MAIRIGTRRMIRHRECETARSVAKLPSVARVNLLGTLVISRQTSAPEKLCDLSAASLIRDS
jgi:hypothetical protein